MPALPAALAEDDTGRFGGVIEERYLGLPAGLRGGVVADHGRVAGRTGEDLPSIHGADRDRHVERLVTADAVQPGKLLRVQAVGRCPAEDGWIGSFMAWSPEQKVSDQGAIVVFLHPAALLYVS